MAAAAPNITYLHATAEISDESLPFLCLFLLPKHFLRNLPPDFPSCLIDQNCITFLSHSLEFGVGLAELLWHSFLGGQSHLKSGLGLEDPNLPSRLVRLGGQFGASY